MEQKQNIYQRLKGCFISALPAALKTSKFLLSIMIPVSLAVTLLKYTGVLEVIAHFLDPLFRFAGLPGDAAVVFITSICINIYSAIAVISTLPFTERELTILALMCLISHSFFLETPIQKKTGSSAVKMISVRLIYSFIGAAMLNYFMPAGSSAIITSSAQQGDITLTSALHTWLKDSLVLIAEIMVLITLLLLLQRILQEFGIIDILAKIFRPLMRIMGLPEAVSFLWLVAYTLGLAYGSAVMFEESENGRLSKDDADLLNHHIAISHSLLEDTLLFVAIGVPALWITFPRIILSIIEVWSLRIRRSLQSQGEPVNAAE